VSIGSRVPFGHSGPKVFITIPNTGWVHKHVVRSLFGLASTPDVQGEIALPTNVPFENNLHHCVNAFMEGPFEWWLSFDSDNPPTGKNPLDLIEHDKDIIGIPTPVWHYTGEKPGERPMYWNGYRWNQDAGGYNEWQPREGLQKVDAIGTGCFLVKRRVFENERMRRAPFARICNDDGTVERGNDISFCERARAQGFEIYCHYDYRASHFKEIELGEVATAFIKLYEGENG